MNKIMLFPNLGEPTNSTDETSSYATKRYNQQQNTSTLHTLTFEKAHTDSEDNYPLQKTEN